MRTLIVITTAISFSIVGQIPLLAQATVHGESNHDLKSDYTAYYAESASNSQTVSLDRECVEPACDNCCPNNRWFATADALFLKRNNSGSNQPIVLNDVSGAVLLSSGDLDFGTVAGPRLSIGRALNECRTVEFSYFGLHDWGASSTVVGNNDLSIPGDLGLATQDFLAADVIGVTYDSELHNAEVNLWTNGERLQWLAGFRYLRLAEEFNLRSTDFDTGTSDYNIRAANNLFGGQIGARYERVYSRLSWDVTGKAGIFGNDASQRTYMGDFDNSTIFRDSHTSDGHVAFVGDFVFNTALQLTEHWAVRGGYNLMWIDGVALATNQIDFTNTPTSGTTLYSNGGVFFHGAHVGLEAQW